MHAEPNNLRNYSFVLGLSISSYFNTGLRFILDFEEAFDTPPHELLKSKLYSYGVGGKTLK